MTSARFTAHSVISLLVAICLFGALTARAPASSASTLQELASTCTVRPAQTAVLNAGVTAAAPGEVITISSEVTFAPGVIYQDVLQRPDGSTYYSTYVELSRPSSALTLLPDSIQFRLNGTAQPVVAGNAPSAGAFTLQSETSSDHQTWRVYFPGDVSAILASASGAGVASYTFAQQTLASLSIDQRMPSTSDVKAGTLFTAASCAASASSGPSNMATAQSSATVSVAEPLLALEKHATSTSASLGDFLDYTLTVTAPELDGSGNTPAVGYSTQLIDQLPAEVVPVDGRDQPLDSMMSTAEGGVWDAAQHTLTFALGDTAPGFSTTIAYRVLVISAPTTTTLRNDAHIVTHGLNESSGGGRLYDPAATANATIPVAGGNPTIEKSAGVSSAPGGVDIPFALIVTLPPDTTFYDLVVDDVLPEMMELGALVSVTCSNSCPAESTNLDPIVHPDGTTSLGWYVGDVGSDPSPRTIEIQYTAHFRNLVSDKVSDQFAYHANGTRLELGATATNTARVLSNSVERLGVVVPTLIHLGNFDSVATAQAHVQYHRPVLGIQKSVITPTTPYDPDPTAPVTYVVTVSNTGDEDAYDIQIEDQLPREIDPSTLDTSAFDSSWIVSSNGSRFTIPGPLAAGGSIALHYTAMLAEKSGVTDASTQVTNTVQVVEFRDGPDQSGFLYSDVADASASFRQAAPKLELSKKLLSPNPTGIGGSTQRWSLTINNVGSGTAFDVKVTDVLPDGLVYVEDSVTSPALLAAGSALDFEFPAGYVISAGGSVSFEFSTRPKSVTGPGEMTNTANLSYKDGAGRTRAIDPSGSPYNYSASASASVVFEAPKLEIVKLPKSAPNTIIEGGTATWTIQVTNTSGVDAGNVVITDPLPSPLSYSPNSAVFQLSPVDPVDGISESIDGQIVTWRLERLKPGQTFTIYVPVTHSPMLPYDGEPELVNTASAVADGLATPVQDAGVLIFVPDRKPPTVTKAVTPDRGAPGTPIEYTVTFTLVSQTQPVFDTTAIDVLPDGIDFVSYGPVSCVSGPCDDAEFGNSPVVLPPVDQPDGSTKLGWYFGDFGSGLVAAAWQMRFTAVIDDTFTDTTGVRRPGAQVQEGVYAPLTNTVRPYADGTDRVIGAMPSLPGMPSSAFDFRGAVARAPFVVETPRVAVAKSANPAQSGPGETVHYTVQVTNAGSKPAYRVHVRDDMGADTPTSSRLRSFSSVPPAGVQVLDGFSYPTDPDVVWLVDQLSPGQTVTIEYDATNPPASELFPGPSGDYRDVARVTNTVTAPEYHSALDPAEPSDVTYSDMVGAKAVSDIYTPLPYTALSGCIDPNRVNNSVTVKVRNSLWDNGRGPGGLVLTPGFPVVGEHPGTLYHAHLEVTYSVELTLFAVVAQGAWLDTEDRVLFRMPDAIVTSGGTTTASWDLGDHPYDRNSADGLELRLVFATSPLASGVVTASLTGDDVSGSTSRGHDAGAPYVYERSAFAAICGTPHDSSTATTSFSKTPDTGGQAPYYAPGDPVDWSLNFTTKPGIEAINPVVTDEFPYGVVYTPGTARFSIGSLDGSTAPTLTEAIVALPGGRTKVTWAGWSTLTQLSVTIPSVIDPALHANGYAPTNQAFLDSDNQVTDGRCFRTDALCDTGSVYVFQPHEPTVQKSVDHPADRYGTSFVYTLDVTIPAGQSFSDVFVQDDLAQDSQLSMRPGPTMMAECVLGCNDPADAIAPVAMMGARTVAGHTYQGWSLGDVAAAVGERVVRIRYVMNAPTLVEALAVRQSTTSFPNTAAVFHSAEDPLDEGFEADGTDPFWYDNLVAGLSTGNMYETASSSVMVSVEYPVVEMTKQCDPAQPERVLAGYNVTCYFTFRNNAEFVAAYDVSVVDTPANTGNWNDNLGGSGSYALDWSYQGVSGPAQVTEPWNGVSIEVRTNPGTEIPARGSLSIAVRFRVNGWAFEPSLSTGWSTGMGEAENAAMIQPWADHDGGSPIIDIDRTESRASLQFLPTNVVAAKALVGATGFKEVVSILTDSCEVPDPEHTCVSGRYVQVGAPETWQIDMGIDQLADLSSINVTDTLPVGFTYVPGSARIASGAYATTMTSLHDPAVTTTSAGCSASPSGHRGGTTLSWAFRKYSTDPLANILWSAAGWARTSTVGSSRLPHQYGVRMLIDVVSNPGCTTSGTVTDTYTNGVVVEATTTTGAIRRSGSLGDAFVLNPMTVSKTPDDGYVPDGTTGWFDIYVDWWYDGTLEPPSDGAADPPCTKAPDCKSSKPKTKGSLVRSFQKTPGSEVPNQSAGLYIQPKFELSDVFHDRGFYVPNSSTVEILPSDGSPAVSATMTETLARTGSGASTVTKLSWELITPLPPASRIGDCTAELRQIYPSCIVPTRVHIRVPVPVPLDTPDGTPLPNQVNAGLQYSIPCLAQSSPGMGVPPKSELHGFGGTKDPTGGSATNSACQPCPVGAQVAPDKSDSSAPWAQRRLADAKISAGLAFGGEQEPGGGGTGGSTPCVLVPLGSWNLHDEGLITVVNPSPPPTPIKSGDEVRAVGTRVDWTVDIELGPKKVWFDLYYLDTLPAEVSFGGYGAYECESGGAPTCVDLQTPETLTPVQHSDGTTTVGWWFGDVVGSGQARSVRLHLWGTVLDRESTVEGTVITNQVSGWSNDIDKLIGSSAAPGSVMDYASAVASWDTIVREPKLAISKRPLASGPLSEGELSRWSVEVTNISEVDVFDFEVTDTPAASLEDVRGTIVTSPSSTVVVSTKGWTSADPRLVWWVDQLHPGDRLEFIVEGPVRSDYAPRGFSEAENDARAGPWRSAPGDSDEIRWYPSIGAHAEIPLSGPRMSIQKYSGDDCVETSQYFAVGVESHWCLVVTNVGNREATHVMVDDYLPPSWTYVVGSATSIVPTVDTQPNGTEHMSWSLGDMQPGAGHAVVLRYSTLPSEGAPIDSHNVAVASATLVDGSTPPASSAAYRAISAANAQQELPGLEISKTPDFQALGILPGGGDVGWDIQVTNPSLTGVTELRLTDFLPEGLSLVSQSCVAGACAGLELVSKTPQPSGRLAVLWTMDSLAPKQSFTVHLVAHIPGSANLEERYVNHVEVEANEVRMVANQASVVAHVPASVGDRVWLDSDTDGIQDSGEVGVAGVSVTLFDDQAAAVKSTVTDADGAYHFEGLSGGSYRIAFELRASDQRPWTLQTAGADRLADSDVSVSDGMTAMFNLNAGDARRDIDAGVVPEGADSSSGGGSSLAVTGVDLLDLVLNGTLVGGMGLIARFGPRVVRRRRRVQ